MKILLICIKCDQKVGAMRDTFKRNFLVMISVSEKDLCMEWCKWSFIVESVFLKYLWGEDIQY
jgi:hypothetical protein